jgi:hypothetical protein
MPVVKSSEAHRYPVAEGLTHYLTTLQRLMLVVGDFTNGPIE